MHTNWGVCLVKVWISALDMVGMSHSSYWIGICPGTYECLCTSARTFLLIRMVCLVSTMLFIFRLYQAFEKPCCLWIIAIIASDLIDQVKRIVPCHLTNKILALICMSRSVENYLQCKFEHRTLTMHLGPLKACRHLPQARNCHWAWLCCSCIYKSASRINSLK